MARIHFLMFCLKRFNDLHCFISNKTCVQIFADKLCKLSIPYVEVRGRFNRKFIPLRSSYFISFISNSSDIIEGDKLL